MVVGRAKVLDISRFPRMSRTVDWQQSQQIPTISFFWPGPFVLRPSEDLLSSDSPNICFIFGVILGARDMSM